MDHRSLLCENILQYAAAVLIKFGTLGIDCFVKILGSFLPLQCQFLSFAVAVEEALK